MERVCRFFVTSVHICMCRRRTRALEGRTSAAEYRGWSLAEVEHAGQASSLGVSHHTPSKHWRIIVQNPNQWISQVFKEPPDGSLYSLKVRCHVHQVLPAPKSCIYCPGASVGPSAPLHLSGLWAPMLNRSRLELLSEIPQPGLLSTIELILSWKTERSLLFKRGLLTFRWSSFIFKHVLCITLQ